METGKKNKRERGREGRGEGDGNKGSKSFRIHYAQALWLSIKLQQQNYNRSEHVRKSSHVTQTRGST